MKMTGIKKGVLSKHIEELSTKEFKAINKFIESLPDLYDGTRIEWYDKLDLKEHLRQCIKEPNSIIEVKLYGIHDYVVYVDGEVLRGQEPIPIEYVGDGLIKVSLFTSKRSGYFNHLTSQLEKIKDHIVSRDVVVKDTSKTLEVSEIVIRLSDSGQANVVPENAKRSGGGGSDH